MADDTTKKIPAHSFVGRVNWAFENGPQGATMALLLLVAFAKHAGDDGLCFPRMDRLAERTGHSERHIRDNVKLLVHGGYVQRERVVHRGKRLGYLYRVLIPGALPVTETPKAAHGVAIPAEWQQPVPLDYQPAGRHTLRDDHDCFADLDSNDEGDEVVEVEQPQLTVVDDTADAEVVEAEVVEASPASEAGEGPAEALNTVVEIEIVRNDRTATLPESPSEPLRAPQNSAVRQGYAPPRADLTGSRELREALQDVVDAASAPPKSAAGSILAYYLLWRGAQGLPRPPEAYVPQIRRAAKTLLDRGMTTVDALHAVLEWHDSNAEAYARGWSIARPGKIIERGERMMIAGVRHGIDGAGLTAKQQAYNAEMAAYDALEDMLAAQS